MENVRFFHPTEEFKQQVQASFEKESRRIACLIPEAEIEHIGATAMPGAVTKGDFDVQFDVQVQVTKAQFEVARQTLELHYEINRPEN